MKFYVDDDVLEEVDNEVNITSFLSVIYNTNPDVELAQATGKIELETIKDYDFKAALQMVKEYSIEVRGDEEKVLEMKRDWTRLFRGLSPTYGPPAPYAQEHLSNKNPQFLAEISEFYMREGYVDYQKFNDRPDYIGIQLDYIRNINVLRINALSSDGSNEYERLTDIRNNFGANYFASWFPSFHEKAHEFVKTDFYRGVLDFTLTYSNSFV